MKVVFVSNFMNHHQLPVAMEMVKRYDYHFIATTPIAKEQLNMKYEDMNTKYDFVVRSYDSAEEYARAMQLINDADVVIFGSAPFKMVKARIEANKLTFRYSERIFKGKLINTIIRYVYPGMWYKYFWQCARYKNKNYYLLCASAYAARDYRWFGAFKGKAYKWGYFPQVEKIDIDKLINSKTENKKLRVLWCNRLVPYKHPKMAIYAARILRDNNINFELNILGVGPLQSKIEKLIAKYNLQNCVFVRGSVPRAEVCENMHKSNIVLLTADRGEGWGAVVNESMNYGCATLCNIATGSVPYLVEDGVNGLVYSSKKEFKDKLLQLATNSDLRITLGSNAYATVSKDWSAETAVQNFDKLVKTIKKGDNNVVKTGPCSKE